MQLKNYAMRQKIITVLVLVSVMVTAFARPALIGHRGSYWGVENSAEAFFAGAEAGYLYLETDVKVAGDGTFILIHDDDTKRLGVKNLRPKLIRRHAVESSTRGKYARWKNICKFARTMAAYRS